MLTISGNVVDVDTVIHDIGNDEIKLKIINIMNKSSYNYRFSSAQELYFILDMRKNIINASKKLFRSRLRFKTFKNSECNEYYWRRTPEGGFLLKSNVQPSKAINDIYNNGWLYGTECATAIVIVYYKAVLDTFGSERFNRIFTDIYLMDWQNLSGKLRVSTNRKPPDIFPGDCRYFKNPDVDPLTPEWQGENAIDLGNNYYYGHGVGITTAENIIYALNNHRKPGSNVSAHLLESSTNPDYRSLYKLYNNY
ncbi:MAG TPA: protein-glutamine gamma-glutamyltransferase [Acetivibrio clariflavus]|nr:protein-glutamine gamma-glutamyltransferase [Acetivibrio clariflavus]HPU42526.1 protein-glutamine gamma-glutamyltransferase [Acetivibrio clariflavus]